VVFGFMRCAGRRSRSVCCWSSSIPFLLNLVAFWLLEWRELLSVHAVTATVLGGLTIPIAVFHWPRVSLLRMILRVATATHARRLAQCVKLLELAPFLTTPVRQW
jgi:hypothetical protein